MSDKNVEFNNPDYLNIIKSSVDETPEKESIIYNTYADLYYEPQIKYTLNEDNKTFTPSIIPPETIVENLQGLLFGDFKYPEEVGGGEDSFNLGSFIQKMPHGIIDKQIPGIGATTLEILSHRNSIIVFPTKVLAYNKFKKHPDSLYVGSSMEDIPTTTKERIMGYLADRKVKNKKLLVVADSLSKVLDVIPEKERNNYFYMIDEIDLLQADSNYRPRLENVIDYYFTFPVRNRCMVSATLNEFSNPKLKNECRFNISWNYNQRRNINLIEADNINKRIAEEIINRKEDKIFIAYNSILNILNVISCLTEEEKGECAILCSEASLLEAGEYYTRLTGKYKLPKRINFATCCYFTGIDIEDKYHLITVSNAIKGYQALSLDRIDQIYGRCRIRGGILSETIIFSKNEKTEYRGTLDQYRNKLINKADNVISLLNSADNIIENNPDLKEFFNSMKEQIRGVTVEKLMDDEPLPIIRTNVEGQAVPAYLNIDYLVGKYRTMLNYRVLQDDFKNALGQKHNINFILDCSEVSEEQRVMEEMNSTELNNVFDEYIDEAVAEIMELDNKDLLTDDELDRRIRCSKRNKKLFYQRFKRLYKYTDLNTLLDLLKETITKDNKAFKNINNAIMYWALDDSHPLKRDIRLAFSKGDYYSATQIQDILKPILFYHFYRELRPRKYINHFKAFYKVKRPRSNYFIISENPLDLKAHKDLIKSHDNNLLKYFIM